MTTLPSHLDDDHHIPDLLGTCSNWGGGLFINYVFFFSFSTINFMIVYLYH